MKKLLIALVLIASACGAGGATAATVGDRMITVSEVAAAAVEGDDGTVDPEVFRTVLEFLVVEEIGAASASSEFQIVPTEEQIDAKMDEFVAQFGGEEAFAQLAADAGFSIGGARLVGRQQVVRDMVTARLLDGAEPIDEGVVQAFYEDNLYQFVDEACASHILVATEEEALAAKDRVEGGEDFATVAGELSTDPSAAANGGDLGCAPLSNYVPEFGNAAALAQIGEVTDPVQSQFGYHIILVASRSDATPLEEVGDLIGQQLNSERSQVLFTDWITAAANSAVVEVDPEYGTWATEGGPRIEPPAGP